MAKEAEWAERVAAWRKSGLRADEFVKGQDYRAKTLVWWSSELARRARKRSEAKGTAARQSQRKVRLGRVWVTQATESGLLVRVGAAEVMVQRGFDGQLLAEVVQALGGAR